MNLLPEFPYKSFIFTDILNSRDELGPPVVTTVVVEFVIWWSRCPRDCSRKCLRGVDCGRSRADGSGGDSRRGRGRGRHVLAAVVVAVVVIAPVVDRSPSSQWSTQWSILLLSRKATFGASSNSWFSVKHLFKETILV